MSKRPTLVAPDLTPIPRVPKTSADDARFKAAQALEEPEAIARRVQEGSVRVINTDTVFHQPPQAPGVNSEPAYKRGPEVALSTKIPDYVARQLKLAAAQRDTTIRNIILDALRRDGFEVQEEDIQDDRKRR